MSSEFRFLETQLLKNDWILAVFLGNYVSNIISLPEPKLPKKSCHICQTYWTGSAFSRHLKGRRYRERAKLEVLCLDVFFITLSLRERTCGSFLSLGFKFCVVYCGEYIISFTSVSSAICLFEMLGQFCHAALYLVCNMVHVQIQNI